MEWGERSGETSVGSIRAFGMFVEGDRCDEKDVGEARNGFLIFLGNAAACCLGRPY